MVVLAMETVTRAGSLALCQGEIWEARSGDPSRPHAERLPGEVLDFLARAGLTLADVDLLAVVSGPGSFTGMRIGLAAAQGLALAGHRRVVGIPTLHALAAAWTTVYPEAALVVPCLDGQRGQVFIAGFGCDGVSALEACPEVIAPAVLRPEEAAALVAAQKADRPVVIVGDGAVTYQDRFLHALPHAIVVDAPMTLAEAAARLAVARPELAGAPHALRPIYIRRPDAELARERAGLGGPGAGALRIARATCVDDLKAVEQLQHQTFTNPWGADAIRWELENTDVARLYIAREPGGALIAYCACWVVFDELHINSFAVDPEWRRRGVARQLLRRVMEESAAAGVRSATLEVRRSNEPARHLYENLGFTIEGTRRDYYQDPREDALILWNRALTGPASAPASQSTPID
ncbi:MAG: tRNA (adenosine(37)-N6)-threonylcarbamoyltransferase complex dimerization subunit type 1 TsaB [Acidobacteriota bacterium]